jgi:hypothetical protein
MPAQERRAGDGANIGQADQDCAIACTARGWRGWPHRRVPELTQCHPGSVVLTVDSLTSASSLIRKRVCAQKVRQSRTPRYGDWNLRGRVLTPGNVEAVVPCRAAERPVAVHELISGAAMMPADQLRNQRPCRMCPCVWVIAQRREISLWRPQDRCLDARGA